jgi:hypothetical protein|tara:strand:- start:1267 stop:1932 length:666 start_codon:yes stop_codon:yes gene_type:complete
MATSGTTSFDLSIEEIIAEAFERCGLSVRSGYDLRTSRRSLNLLFAEWANRGLNLWTIEQRTKTLTAGTTSYDLDADLVDILSAVLFTANDTTVDKQLERLSRAEYLHISKKTTSAVSTQYYLERSITPKLFLYPTPNAADTFKYYALTRIQDAGSYSGNAEVPFRFLPCLVAGLSYYIAMKKAPERIQLLKQVYEDEWTRASQEDSTRSSLRIVPNVGVM